MAKVIGIDLGTSNSAAAVMEGGRPVIIPSAEGAGVASGKAFPSFVAFTKDGDSVSWASRPGARRPSTPTARSTPPSARWAPTSSSRSHGKEYTPQQVSAFILQKIKQDAEAYLGEHGRGGGHHLPGLFRRQPAHGHQGRGRDRGPEGAAHHQRAHGRLPRLRPREGGQGAEDPRVRLRRRHPRRHHHGDVEGGRRSRSSARAATPSSAARTWTTCSSSTSTKEFKRETGIDLKKDTMATQRVREAAEKAKVELSSTLTDGHQPAVHHGRRERAQAPHHDREPGQARGADRPDRRALPAPARAGPEGRDGRVLQGRREFGENGADIDKIIMVGGPTRMPIVQKFVEEFFGKKIERGVDPMECVALGAAIQAAIIKGEVKDVLLLDVTPLSLGIETLGGVFTKLIERNTTIPTRKSQIFSTAADSQTAVTIRVLQGERQMADDNVELGRFDLVGHPPRAARRAAGRGGVRHRRQRHRDVAAKDLGTGKEQSIKITAPKKLSKEEIEKMVQEAEQFAADDAKRRRRSRRSTRPTRWPTPTEKSAQGLRRQGEPGRAGRYRGEAERPEDRDQGQERRPDQEGHRGADEGLAQAGRGDLQADPGEGQPGSRPRAASGQAGPGAGRQAAAGARRTTTSSTRSSAREKRRSSRGFGVQLRPPAKTGAKRDYYDVLGVKKERHPRGDPQGLPGARAPPPPGPGAGRGERSRRRSGSRRCPRPTRCSRTRRSGRSTTSTATRASTRNTPGRTCSGARTSRSAFEGMGDLGSARTFREPVQRHGLRHIRRRGRRSAARSQPRRAGRDLEIAIAVTLDEARGAPRRRSPCRATTRARRAGARGRGREHSARRARSAEARAGSAWCQGGIFQMAQPCPRCGGTGTIVTSPVRTAAARDEIKVTRTISVKVPAGVDTGSRLRVKGEGEAGPAGTGDLYVIVEVLPHPVFKRQDNNLVTEKTVGMARRSSGPGQVPTLEGGVTMKIPAGTQPGRTFRLKGRGIP